MRTHNWNHTTIGLAAATFVVLIGFLSIQAINAQTVAKQEIEENGNVASLEQRLTNGLKARTEKEKAYVKRVVAYVQTGKIPKSLVDSTFLWVQKNRAGGNYPIFYFKRVLNLRAKAIHVQVPQ